ncbi:hypothetical protein RHS01_05505 [Rhizoctonia solani]|uniref:Uncharacterized protein n=1 Tax=Rhizoctonia solani TaxID=456999 RepID=A0A8H7IDQ3_9AGAM|nr:hypothetical protein RHS01_05505 [Rhizoctonia solani]
MKQVNGVRTERLEEQTARQSPSKRLGPHQNQSRAKKEQKGDTSTLRRPSAIQPGTVGRTSQAEEEHNRMKNWDVPKAAVPVPPSAMMLRRNNHSSNPTVPISSPYAHQRSPNFHTDQLKRRHSRQTTTFAAPPKVVAVAVFVVVGWRGRRDDERDASNEQRNEFESEHGLKRMLKRTERSKGKSTELRGQRTRGWVYDDLAHNPSAKTDKLAGGGLDGAVSDSGLGHVKSVMSSTITWRSRHKVN